MQASLNFYYNFNSNKQEETALLNNKLISTVFPYFMLARESMAYVFKKFKQFFPSAQNVRFDQTVSFWFYLNSK